MTTKEPREALERLTARAGIRAVKNADNTRVVLQLDHSSSAVGGGEVAAALTETLPDSAYLVIAGSDGASFQAPKIVVTTPEGAVKSFEERQLVGCFRDRPWDRRAGFDETERRPAFLQLPTQGRTRLSGRHKRDRHP